MLTKKWEESWIKLIDWSRMENTFKLLSKKQKQIVLENGCWSQGKGKFERGEQP